MSTCVEEPLLEVYRKLVAILDPLDDETRRRVLRRIQEDNDRKARELVAFLKREEER